VEGSAKTTGNSKKLAIKFNCKMENYQVLLIDFNEVKRKLKI
jgi:hypothetical protein